MKEHYHQAYFEVSDVICSTIEDRFRQPGYQLYSNLEQLLLKAVRKENYSSEFDFVTKCYESDLNVHALEMQLQTFATNFTMEGKNTSINDTLKYLRNISSLQRTLLSEICIIAKLRLVMPATNVVSERLFGALLEGQDILAIYNETNSSKSLDDSSCPLKRKQIA